ncbi:MAG: histone deacetylase [bacterium]|jgi:acetoin utilization deacetylase AcuC-like enzyme
MTPLEHVSYHPDYVIPLPEGHAFPMRKYEFLHAILVEEGLVGPWNEHRPGEVAWELLALAHDEGYLAKLRDGTLTSDEQRRIGMEWSPRLVRRARLAVQGTIDAAVAALRGRGRLAANLAGGTHHALRDAGEGYCTLNDVAVAARFLQREYGVERILVVDLDVHHGNGTASIFAGDPAVFTFSMHGAKNFPLKKPPSSLDVPLADGLGDEAYLATLAEHLPRAIDAAGPQFAFYLGGVDVAAGDRFGRLALTEMGIAARDRMVLDQVAGRGIPLCLTLSGGYATGDDGRTSSERTAALHAITHREAVAFLSRDSR